MSPRTAAAPKPKAEEPPEPDPEHEGEGEPEEGHEPEPEPEPEPDDAQATARKLDNAMRKYRKDVEGILGGLEDAAPCPTCDGFAFVPVGQAFRKRETSERCPTCGGLGQQETGSLVPDQMHLACEECTGRGWINKLPANVRTLEQAPPPGPPVAQAERVHGWFDATTQTFHPYAETT